ncbi:hypothetical protein LV454_28995, partial [Escherichia coli]|uniref:hypothetical protein n=1 Tax=Escherichia coli TaxID=562 RepID=UPI001F4349C3
IFTNPEKVQELIHVVKQSMMNETFDEMYSTKESWASINFMDGKGQYVQEASWEKSYSEVEAWLSKDTFNYLERQNAALIPG